MTEQMKPSGIPWIGDIPSTWEIGRVKDYYDLQTGFTPDTSVSEYYDDENGELWVSIADMDSRNISSTKSKVSKTYIRQYRPVISPTGSLLYSFKLSVGKVSFISEDMYTNEAIATFYPQNVCLQYFYYSSAFIEENAKKNIYGAKILNQDSIKNAYVPFPASREQKMIADYLDGRCAEIDSIIADIEKQIELLKQYKKSLITETVTKGLDKSVPMKDSGIEWIGAIPKKWFCKKLKYVCNRIGDIDHYMPDSVDDGIPYVMTGDFIGEANRIDFDNCKKISQKDFSQLSKRIKPEYGDILLARYATIGVVRYVDTNRDFLVSYSCAIIKLSKSEMLSKYVYYFLKSNVFVEELKKFVNTNTQGNVGLDSIGKCKIPVPPVSEQIKIADSLDKQCEKIDAIISDKLQQLDIIQKHKKSLIYEYVTGKKRVKEAM